MTVENTINRHKKLIAQGNHQEAEHLKKHILSSKKYRGHFYLKELVDVEVEVNLNKEINIQPDNTQLVSNEDLKKEDGKKSKG